MNFWNNLFSLPELYFFLLKNIIKQKKFLRKEIEIELVGFEKDNDGSLKPSDFKKFSFYYGLGVPAILGESFAVLRGKPLSSGERSCLTYLGGISGLLDDFFDDPEREAGHLQEFILTPEKLIPQDTAENFLWNFFNSGLNFSPHPYLLKKQALKVFKAQQHSLIQKEKISDHFQLKECTLLKGGTSFVFYRLCLFDIPEKPEEKMIFHLGGLMQLGNDIFDVWKDLQEGTKTIATETKDIRELRKLFNSEIHEMQRLTMELPFPENRKKRFVQLTIVVMSRVFVILDQFEKLQESSGNVFQPEKYTRKKLICDMERPKNQLRATKYFLFWTSGKLK